MTSMDAVEKEIEREFQALRKMPPHEARLKIERMIRRHPTRQDFWRTVEARYSHSRAFMQHEAMRQKIDTAVSTVAGTAPYRPYQIMSKQDLADLLILNELAEKDALPGKFFPKAKDLVKRWLDDAWLSIVWEARHAGFKPEEAQKVISDEGLKAAEYLYNTKEFQPMFGGLKWATISANTRRAFQSWESGAARAMLSDMVNAIYTEHNTGLFGEKLMQPAAKIAVKDARDPYYGGLGSLLKSASKDVQAAAKGLIEEPKFVEPEFDEDDFPASYQKKYAPAKGSQEPWWPEPLSKKPETKLPKRGPKSRPWWGDRPQYEF